MFSPDKVEYWFDLGVKDIIVALHFLLKEMDRDGDRLLNITIEHTDGSNYSEHKYTMVILKSRYSVTKESLILYLKKILGVNNNGKSRFRYD